MPTFDRRGPALKHGHALADLSSGAATDGYVLTADGAGAAAWEAAASGGGLLECKVKTSDTAKSTTSDTTLVSETDFDVTITTAGLYVLEWHMYMHTTAGAPGHKYQIDYTGTVDAIRLFTVMYDNSSTRSFVYASGVGPNVHNWTGANELHMFHGYAYIDVSTTGTLGYSWANNATSAGQTVTMYTGSHWTIREANV